MRRLFAIAYLSALIAMALPAQSLNGLQYPYAASFSALTSSQSATGLVPAGAPSGLYEVKGCVTTTTAGSAGTVTLTVAWNNGASQSTTTSTAALATLGANQCVDLPITIASSTAINWSTTVASAAGSPQYAISISARYLGSAVTGSGGGGTPPSFVQFAYAENSSSSQTGHDTAGGADTTANKIWAMNFGVNDAYLAFGYVSGTSSAYTLTPAASLTATPVSGSPYAGSGGNNLQAWTAPTGAGGSNVGGDQHGWTTASSFSSLGVLEYSGTPTTSFVDAANTCSTASSVTSFTCSVTTTAAEEMVVSACVIGGNSASQMTAGAGETARISSASPMSGGTMSNGFIVQEVVQVSAGSATVGCSATNAGAAAIFVVALKHL